MSSDGDYCRDQAARCARFAEEATTDEAKARLLELQKTWLQQAAEADAELNPASDQNRPLRITKTGH